MNRTTFLNLRSIFLSTGGSDVVDFLYGFVMTDRRAFSPFLVSFSLVTTF